MTRTICCGFLSTPSARRATCPDCNCFRHHGYFYPRPPRGGRPRHLDERSHENVISIHALREEGDETPTSGRQTSCDFYPRPPRGGRRHLPLGRGQKRDFYPRPPRGGRLSSWSSDLADIIFLSTPSARRATSHRARTVLSGRISIHALREEGDNSGTMLRTMLCDFYPRPPRGGRLFV